MIIFDLNPFWIKTSGTNKGRFYEDGPSFNKAPSPTHLKSTVFSYRVKQLSKCFNSIEAKLSSRKLRWQFVFLEEKISGFSCTLATSSLFLFSLRFFWGIEAKTLHIFLWKGKTPFFLFSQAKASTTLCFLVELFVTVCGVIYLREFYHHFYKFYQKNLERKQFWVISEKMHGKMLTTLQSVVNACDTYVLQPCVSWPFFLAN